MDAATESLRTGSWLMEAEKLVTELAKKEEELQKQADAKQFGECAKLQGQIDVLLSKLEFYESLDRIIQQKEEAIKERLEKEYKEWLLQFEDPKIHSKKREALREQVLEIDLAEIPVQGILERLEADIREVAESLNLVEETDPEILAQINMDASVSILDSIQDQVRLEQSSTMKETLTSRNTSDSICKSENKPVTIDVGGKIFRTTIRTLKKSWEGSTIYRQFCGQRITAMELSPGVYFIDDDPVVFGHILEFLRTGEVIGASLGTKKRLINRSVHYNLLNMRSHLLSTDHRLRELSGSTSLDFSDEEADLKVPDTNERKAAKKTDAAKEPIPGPSKSSCQHDFHEGMWVKLVGLSSSKELDGTLGRIVILNIKPNAHVVSLLDGNVVSVLDHLLQPCEMDTPSPHPTLSNFNVPQKQDSVTIESCSDPMQDVDYIVKTSIWSNRWKYRFASPSLLKQQEVIQVLSIFSSAACAEALVDSEVQDLTDSEEVQEYVDILHPIAGEVRSTGKMTLVDESSNLVSIGTSERANEIGCATWDCIIEDGKEVWFRKGCGKNEEFAFINNYDSDDEPWFCFPDISWDEEFITADSGTHFVRRKPNKTKQQLKHEKLDEDSMFIIKYEGKYHISEKETERYFARNLLAQKGFLNPSCLVEYSDIPRYLYMQNMRDIFSTVGPIKNIHWKFFRQERKAYVEYECWEHAQFAMVLLEGVMEDIFPEGDNSMSVRLVSSIEERVKVGINVKAFAPSELKLFERNLGYLSIFVAS